MAHRGLLVALIVAATAAFVVGTTLERSSGESGQYDQAATVTTAASATESSGESGSEAPGAHSHGETAAQHARESGGGASATATEQAHPELRPLGVDVEAWPFVVIAAVASLVLAAAAWLRPTVAPLLVLVALAMLVFVALDVREIAHQHDENRSDLAVLAGAVTALHGAAMVVAVAMALRAWRARPGGSGGAQTAPA
ncbi:MAG: hypothetical protein QOJ35_1360 [Solirubrobacteraceae bacterium]|jgi:Flp pilus assembly protein TadB|nr:hypothetical protein [Solirubrobacteraceae bacterium]